MDGEGVREGYSFRGRPDQRDVTDRDIRDSFTEKRQRERWDII